MEKNMCELFTKPYDRKQLIFCQLNFISANNVKAKCITNIREPKADHSDFTETYTVLDHWRKMINNATRSAVMNKK